MEEREDTIIMKKKLKVNAAPEFHDLFLNSKFVSRKVVPHNALDQNGKFYQFLRSERKRTYRQIENDNLEKNNELRSLINRKLDLEQQLLTMSEELRVMQAQEDQTDNYKLKIEHLIETGILDENGDPL